MCPPRSRTGLAILIILLATLAPLQTAAAASRPGYVYDLAGILDEYDEAAIGGLCEEVDEATRAEIVVVTLPDLSEYGGDVDLARYRYFNDEPLDGVRGIGKPGEDNGVLILVAMEERAYGIEVGLGLEGDLTDSESGRILREALAPQFREGEYYYGLYLTAARVAEELGVDVEGLDPGGSPGGWDIIEVLLDGDIGYFIWWLLGGSDLGSGLALLIILVIIGVGIATRRRTGGRSRGGGASGRW